MRKIRSKLLVLLLGMALVPMILVGLVHRLTMDQLSRKLSGTSRRAIEDQADTSETVLEELGDESQQALVDTARANLQRIVEDYSQILDRNSRILELALRLQATEAEQCLAEPAPADAKVLMASSFDTGQGVPSDSAPSPVHRMAAGPDKLRPMRVAYSAQAFLPVRGVSASSLRDDMARLSPMSTAYRQIHDAVGGLVFWQFTALGKGLHCTYPAHGGYPADYDPRLRPWYTLAKERFEKGNAEVWLPPSVDVTTGDRMLSLSKAIRYPDGTFAGVTGIDVLVDTIFHGLKLPTPWMRKSASMLVLPGRFLAAYADRQLVILVRKRYPAPKADWRRPVTLEELHAADRTKLEQIITASLAGRSGVVRMPYEGTDSLWAYGPSLSGVFPLVIVPYPLVVERAREAKDKMLARTTHVEAAAVRRIEGIDNEFASRTLTALQISGAIALVVLAVAALVAIRSAHSVTEPIQKLADAVGRLSAGDYDATVDVHTHDEIQDLAEAFNAMGPRLREREAMKRSLALAMEIQQGLLPQQAPTCPGVDVAGRSVYCDETGGDYYDFIDLMELGPGRIGIALGDVTGHGIGAALLMASARAVLRSHAVSHGMDLVKLFDALNLHLVHDTGDARFMTLFYGILDESNRSLIWASAGQDPAMLLRAGSDEVEELPNTGPPLGVVDGVRFGQEGPVTLSDGDICLVGTDGIWEARNEQSEEFGKQRLYEVMRAHRDASAEEIRQAVVDAVNAFRESHPQEDDITLVVLKARPAE